MLKPDEFLSICTQTLAHEIEIDVPKVIQQGDMPGDKISICQDHIQKARTIFPLLLNNIKENIIESGNAKIIVSVCGGSGVGKSETASLLAHFFRSVGIGSYTLSGDNYPHRIPMYNDAERLRVFRSGGVEGLVTAGLFTPEIKEKLLELQEAETDAGIELTAQHTWLNKYQSEGKHSLKSYLGSTHEIGFEKISTISSLFKNGANEIWLKRMGRTQSELWYESVDFSKINVLIIEWTHGNSDNFKGVDIPVLLNSTPAETQAHRKARNRDGKVDSPFTSVVLEIEQDMLKAQAYKAKIIVAKNGDILSQAQYIKLMCN